MNIGDTLIDTKGNKWLIFDLSESFVFVVDLETQIVGHAFGLNDPFTIEVKPDNVEYMFIKRRQANMKALFKGI